MEMSDTQEQSRVTIVGTGNMGAALVSALLKAGVPVTIWNRTAERPRVRSLVQAGAEFDKNLHSAISRSAKLVVFSVVDFTSFSAILTGFESSTDLSGKIVINLGNGTPVEALRAEALAKKLGATNYFQGAVMATPQLVATPQSSVIYGGGTESEFEQVFDALKPFGRPVYQGPDVDTVAIIDCATLASVFGMFSGGLVGLGLLSRLRTQTNGQFTAMKPVVDQIMVPMLRELVSYISEVASLIDSENWEENIGNPLSMQIAGVRYVRRACSELGVDGSFLDGIEVIMQQAIDEERPDVGLAMAWKHLMGEL